MARNSKSRNPERNNSPSFKAYHVAEGENGFWTQIGAAWSHEDGNGMTLQLNLIPAGSDRIVLRKVNAEEKAA